MKPAERIYGFDALRAIAMWLGVVLHSLIVYKATPAPNWPYDNEAGYVFFDWLYEYIHIFRMPLFYLVAGFFSRLVITKSGLTHFVKQRYKRIFIPFVFSVILLLPVTLLPFHFYKFYYADNLAFAEALTLSSKQMLHWNGFAHLWFLYYLLFFYIIAIVFYMVSKKIQVHKYVNLSAIMNRFHLLHIAVLIVILWAVLQLFNIYTPVVYTGIKPNVIYFVYYGLFFFTGWLMQINSNSVFSLSQYAWLYFLSGTVISVVRFLYHLQPGAFAYLITAIETVCLVMGLIGIFIKQFNSASKSWRYFSDSSYWVYLVHVFIVASVQILLLHSVVPPFLRMIVVLLTALVLSLLSYHYFVRFTIIGTYLHGKRLRE